MQKQQNGYTTDYLSQLLERNDRDFHAFKQLNPIEQARHQAQAYLFYAHNPWAFLSDCVFTLNQISLDENAVQPFPSYLEYLRFLAELWQRERLLGIPKSRRMTCSWSFISLYTHDTIFNEGRFNAFVSKKEDDAGELVSRAEFIYNKIPEWRIPKVLLPKIKNGRVTKDPWILEFENTNSLIRAFPQGADQMRQFTISGILGDECAFWSQAQAFYSASKPTIDGGGRMTLISSRSPGFFKKIVFDQMNAPDLNFREVPPVPIKKPMEGVEVWKNPNNKFVIVDLHYTADPRKRGAEWREAIKSSMPARDFGMEYEKNWTTFEEIPVLPDFNKDLHSTSYPVKPTANLPLILTFSFGNTPSCIIAQMNGRTLKVLKEFQEKGSIAKLAQIVWNHLNLEFLPWMHGNDKIYVYAHPEGFKKNPNDQFSCIQILKRTGFKRILAAEGVWETRKTALEDFLTKTYAEGPAFLVSDQCPVLIEGLGGGYRYKKGTTDEETETAIPIKDKYMRIAQCAEFLCAAVSNTKMLKNIELPTPSYGFQS